jgi:hypothetical protein
MFSPPPGSPSSRARAASQPLLAIPEPEPVVLHPGLAGIYAGKVSKLAEALNEDGTWAEADDLLRGLIEKVIGRSRPKADGQLKGSSPPFCPNFG